MIRRPPRSTQSRSSAASDVYKRQDDRQQSRREWTPSPWDVTASIQSDIDGSMIDVRSPTIGPTRPRSPEMRVSQKGPRDTEEDRPELRPRGIGHVSPRRQSWVMENDGLLVTLTSVCRIKTIPVLERKRRVVTIWRPDVEPNGPHLSDLFRLWMMVTWEEPPT